MFYEIEYRIMFTHLSVRFLLQKGNSLQTFTLRVLTSKSFLLVVTLSIGLQNTGNILSQEYTKHLIQYQQLNHTNAYLVPNVMLFRLGKLHLALPRIQDSTFLSEQYSSTLKLHKELQDLGILDVASQILKSGFTNLKCGSHYICLVPNMGLLSQEHYILPTFNI